MRRLALATTLAALPLAAAAQSQLERLEELSERSNDLVMSGMVQMMAAEGMDTSMLPEIPEMEWNDRMRAAGTCMLEAYTAEIGSGGVDTMLDNMGVALDKAEGMSLEEMGEMMASDILPEGLTEDRSIEISQDCGMMEAQLEWMDETGFMDAMLGADMQPDG